MEHRWLAIFSENRVPVCIEFMIGVCAEVVAHRLDEVRGESAAAVAIEIG